MDLKKVDNIHIDGIDHSDYPDYSDAYISSADFDGRQMTEIESEYLNGQTDMIRRIINELFFSEI